jgi:glutamyl-tRNA synthetase/glutamyl-Q tRNA(Asp) synthetase
VIVSRFAPAPTGLLHLGHVVNAVHVWGVTRAAGGRVLLRIEDHDRQRCRAEYERAILDELDWLGFVPDDPPTEAFRSGRCRGRQSDRHDVYESALARLRAAGLTYACECSRRDVDARRATDDEHELAGRESAGNGWADERPYAGTCAAKGLPERSDRGLRVRLPSSVERFVDLRHGLQEQRPSEQCGDLLIRDRLGNWTYQFVATVDDCEQGVTLVIRGDDLLASTGRQIQLARMLGRVEPPRFLHHPLIMKTATQKLSKSDGDSGVRDLRARGWSAADVIGAAAALAGLTDTPGPLGADDIKRLRIWASGYLDI